ncbi:hypothetical protein VTN77DRAFT_6647 [Rasamsonia byssochlamydoides]|uniref:uncharacterized protein n=1 Tax=Rasamsonia byssochlamydoides TaxID=89139 RepID=UPI00374241A8
MSYYSTTAPSQNSDESRRIHILGTGNIGALVAHTLAGLPEQIRPRITLLLHRKSLLDAWRKRGEKLDVLRYEDGASQPRSGIDVELVEPDSNGGSKNSDSAEGNPAIRHLIVSVKAPQTVSALRAIKDRLGPASTILFLQNGMGSPDEAAEKLFPALDTRPRFMQGIVLPGAFMIEPFVVRHAALGDIPMSVLPRRDDSDNEIIDSSRYLMDTLTQAPVLGAKEVEYTELLQRQLEKLTANAIANPLTAILNEANHVLVHPHMQPLIRSLLAETALIIRSLPELQSVPGAQERFATKRLEDRILPYLDQVKQNISSMCQDLRAGKKTEIEYINGYLVKRAREIGVPCELNATLLQMVLTKQAVVTKS